MAKETECPTIYSIHCEQEFKTLNRKLDKISATLEGNNGAGLRIMVDRHNQWIQSVKKLLWIMVTAIASIFGWIAKVMIVG